MSVGMRSVVYGLSLASFPFFIFMPSVSWMKLDSKLVKDE